MKARMLLCAVLLLAVPAYAETIQVTARSCPECWALLEPGKGLVMPVLPTVELIMTLSVEPTSGQHWDYHWSRFLTGPFLEVTSLHGSINGRELALRATANGTSWLSGTYMPGMITFYTGEAESRIFTENFKNYSLLSAGGPDLWNVPVRWTVTPTVTAAAASSVPELPSLSLLVVSVGLIMLGRSFRRSLLLRQR